MSIHNNQLLIVYKKISNPWVDKLVYERRKRFGVKLAEMKNTLRTIIQLKDEPMGICLVGDQAADPHHGYWTTFLNREAVFFRGAAKMAIRFNYPTLYMYGSRPKRGKTLLKTELLYDGIEDIKEEELIERYKQRLEENIKDQPELWLWSHRRWKHVRNQ